MISFDKAYELVMNSAIPTDNIRIPLEKSLGRVIAQDVISDTDMPPFDKSAMDGYACKKEDLANELTIIEDIPAGYVPQKAISSHKCSKIMTGGQVPEGADCIIMIEHTEEISDARICYTKTDNPGNICYKGEDIKAGDLLIGKGDIISPQAIAIMATVGCCDPIVACRPRVGVIATGSELVAPSEKLEGARIRNSNSWQLAAQAEALGVEAINYGIVEDTEKAIDSGIKKASEENDIVIISGGVSMGDFDLVPGILINNGVDILFDRVSIKPGKPSNFGIKDNTRYFALPGNPVATFVQFEMFIKPFIFKMMGHNYDPKKVTQKLSRDLQRKRAERMSIIPVTFDAPGYVKPIEYHGSAHINAMHNADGFFTFPINQKFIEKDSTVEIRLLA